MRVVVTGAAGFIGANFVQYLKANHPELQLDLVDLQFGRDLKDAQLCQEICWGKDLVFHFGNHSHVEKSIPPSAAKGFLQNNIFSTWNILDASRDNRAKMIYISSSEVYGSAQNEYLNDRGQMDEKHPLCPHSPYAASKAAADRACYSHWKTYGTDVRIVRPFNQFGPGQASEKLIPKIIEYQLRGEPFPAEDGGLQSRDYLFVKDTCRGLWMSQDLPAGEAVNLSYGEDFSVRWFAEKIWEILKNMGKLPMRQNPGIGPSVAAPWISKGSRLGQVKRLCGSHEKAKRLLGWIPEFPIEQALEQTCFAMVGAGINRPPDASMMQQRLAER